MHLTPFAISGLLIIVVCLPLLVFVLVKGRTKVSFIFSLHILATLFWGVGSFAVGINTNPEIALTIWKFAKIPVLFISVTIFHTVITLTKRKLQAAIFFAYLQAFCFLILNFQNKLIFSTKLMFNSLYYYQGTKYYLSSFLIWLIFVVWANLELIYYYKMSYPKQKRQLLFLLFGILLGFLGGTTNYLPGFNINVYPYGNFLVPIYFLIVAYAILRHQLLDIEIVIQKGFVYSVLIAVITIIYFIIIYIIEHLFQGWIGYRSFVSSLLSAITIALVFIPLKNRIQSLVDRLFFQKSPTEMEEENKLLLREMEKTDKFKNVATLASGMAHEVKNPLTTIRTLAEYLPRKLDDPQFIEKFSRLVPKEIDRIDAMVQELLQFSRPSPPKLEPTDLYELLNNTLGFLSNNFSQRKIDVEKDYEAIKDRKFLLDANQIKQVVLNLCLNAIDAMPQGGNLTISTQLSAIGSQTSAKSLKTDGRLLMTVKDTGCGISLEAQKNLFTPFFTTKEKGTGLGLSVTKGIIEQHGGKITVKSKVGEGTTFTLELPLSKDQPD